jgi:hypothetical protein
LITEDAMRATFWNLRAGRGAHDGGGERGGAQGRATCDRECPIGLIDAYLSAIVARDPAKARVTANVRFA